VIRYYHFQIVVSCRSLVLESFSLRRKTTVANWTFFLAPIWIFDLKSSWFVIGTYLASVLESQWPINITRNSLKVEGVNMALDLTVNFLSFGSGILGWESLVANGTYSFQFSVNGLGKFYWAFLIVLVLELVNLIPYWLCCYRDVTILFCVSANVPNCSRRPKILLVCS
jgi:hypothetical protein